MVNKLKSRIEAIEKRIEIDEGPLTLIEILYAIKLENPEAARRYAMDPTCHDHRLWQEVVNSPTPKRVIRYFRRQQLEQLTKAPASSSDRTRETAHSRVDSPRGLETPEEKHES